MARGARIGRHGANRRGPYLRAGRRGLALSILIGLVTAFSWAIDESYTAGNVDAFALTSRDRLFLLWRPVLATLFSVSGAFWSVVLWRRGRTAAGVVVSLCAATGLLAAAAVYLMTGASND
ncbi:MAG: hypothetical protein QOD61_1780 [Solirubrobacteraceae bacterium]|jgi:hypothetical protein|nr:hypothetical protein [Solirubrobacteraceae bacterium]